MPKSEIYRAYEILSQEYPDFTLLDNLAWLSGYFKNDMPDLSTLLDYIVSKDVIKKTGSAFIK